MVRAGDIIGVRGSGWLSDHIVAATPPGPLSHIAVVTATAPMLQCTEALSRVRTRPLTVTIGAAAGAWSIEWEAISDQQRDEIVMSALSFSADDYGYGDIALEGADSLFQTRWFTAHFATQKLPICSMLAALAVTSAGLTLGVSPSSITPNDVWNYAIAHPAILTVTKLK